MKLVKRVAAVLSGVALLGAIAAAVPASAAVATAPTGAQAPVGNGAVEEIAPPEDLLKILRTKKLPSDVRCWKFEMTFGSSWDGIGCFEWNGDDLWVKDIEDNGKNFRIHAETTSGSSSYCNAPGGPGWSQCNYDYKESACVRLHGYHPPHAAGLHAPWARWVRVSSGKNCQ